MNSRLRGSTLLLRGGVLHAHGGEKSGSFLQ